MKKSISICLIIALICSLAYSYIVYAVDEENFFEVSSEEILKTESLEMTINLGAIEYDSFIFELCSDYSLENVEIQGEESASDTEIELSTESDNEEENTENQIQIEVAKSDNIEKIILVYTLPDDVEVGDIITFKATIINSENEEETENIQVEVTVVEETTEAEEGETSEEDTSSESETEKNNTDYNLSENVNNVQNTDTGIEQSTEKMQNLYNSQSTDDSQNMQMSISTGADSQTTMSTETTTVDGLEENEVTYNGSDNNYLSELYIEDVDLTQDFQKDKTTYFATVDSDVDEIEIVATAENDDATVCIYGNEDLEEGVNKILVSVTAENGNVRTYRIYVTKN